MAALDGYPRRRIKIQDLNRHSMLLCRANAPPERAPRGNLARELSKAISAEKGKGKGVKGASQPSQWTQIETAKAPLRKDCWKDGGVGGKVSPSLQEANENRS